MNTSFVSNVLWWFRKV